MTKQQRLLVYKEMYAIMLKEEFYCVGFCYYNFEALKNLGFTKNTTYLYSKNNKFKELNKYKPKGVVEGEYWYPCNKKWFEMRMIALQKIILEMEFENGKSKL